MSPSPEDQWRPPEPPGRPPRPGGGPGGPARPPTSRPRWLPWVLIGLILAATALSGTGFILAFPVPTLIVLFIAAGIAGLLAAAWPARRAARVDILEALATE